ncbi:MAG: hypothetical protein QNK30_15005 [Bacteroidales bacterium]|nr:hypothetical protein [Bacteroidales bacterium]
MAKLNNPKRYNIDSFVEKLCKKNCYFEIETSVQKELDRTELGNTENIDPSIWEDYRQGIQDISTYVNDGKFLNKKPNYQPLIDKFGE